MYRCGSSASPVAMHAATHSTSLTTRLLHRRLSRMGGLCLTPPVHAPALTVARRLGTQRTRDASAALDVAPTPSTTAVSADAATGTATQPQPKLRVARPSPRSIAQVKQTPLFPGTLRHVTRFEGEHVYRYGLHTYTIMRDSAAMAVVPAGCLLGYIVTHVPSIPLVPFELQCVYMVGLFILSRCMAAGKRNRCVKDLTGRHVVLTGGTSGIGRATAAQLAAMGADVTLVARDSPHAAAALEFVRAHATASATQHIELQPLHLEDLIAVRDFCKRARQSRRPIDILVNVAGVLQEHHVTTRFGDDVQLAVNYLGPYLLTEGLLPLVEAVQGRIVYVSCAAHVGVKGNVVSTYLSGRGVWSPRVADRFDGLEQYGFTKLGNIFHAQQLAVRSYPAPEKGTITSRLTRSPSSSSSQPATAGRPQPTSRKSTSVPSDKDATAAAAEPRFTICACSPGGVATNLYRSVPLAGTFVYLYYVYILVLRTAWEGSQTVVNCCVRDDFKNGGYYVNTRYRPAGLSKTACSVTEREQVMAWTSNKMKPYMKWE
ncbi:beta-ketoacyl-ACP reductase 2 [Novymonas esmeraldas]|uniref:Beta-ketoacyl-ACP reductase 2 n=1 Tax=Novymonas esmeraldas TaxID=1808958 RepID=A0AAW0ES99_9TRYP